MISFLLICQLYAHPSNMSTGGLMNGFLYSKSSDSFISKNTVSREDSIPLRFTVRLENVEEHSSEFRVVKIDGIGGSEHTLSINSRGEAKLFKGKMCEAAHRTFLASQRCSKDPREIFMWIPEDSFESFVRHIDHRRKHRNLNKLHKKYNSKRNNGKRRRRYDNDCTTSNDTNSRPHSNTNNKGPHSNTKDSPANYSNTKDSPVNTKDSKDKVDPTAEQIYANLFKNYMEIFCQNNSKFDQCSSFRKPSTSVKIAEPLIPENITNFLISLFKKYGINQPSLLYRKNRGIYSQGADPLLISNHANGFNINNNNTDNCRCKMECVKNSKNGMCFYKYNNGKLEPIMKNQNCCKSNQAGGGLNQAGGIFNQAGGFNGGFACDLKNKIEKMLCELAMRNDYEFFSQYIDENHTRLA